MHVVAEIGNPRDALAADGQLLADRFILGLADEIIQEQAGIVSEQFQRRIPRTS